jgi:hypothetical protein
VQAQLAARRVASDRPSKHEHYLRGSLFCADCGGRLLYTQNSGNGGTYEYFSCINRVSRHGGQGLLPGRPLPRRQDRQGARGALQERPPDARKAARDRGRRQGRRRGTHGNRAARRRRPPARPRITRGAAGAPRQAVLQGSRLRRRARAQAAGARGRASTHPRPARKAQQHADDIEAELAEILERTKTPHATYLAGTPLERRILNQTFFKRILVGEDAQVLGVTLTPAYAAVAAWQPSFGQPSPTSGDAQRTAQEGRRTAEDAPPAVRGTESTNPGPFLRDQGLNFLQMVETVGTVRLYRAENPPVCYPSATSGRRRVDRNGMTSALFRSWNLRAIRRLRTRASWCP